MKPVAIAGLAIIFSSQLHSSAKTHSFVSCPDHFSGKKLTIVVGAESAFYISGLSFLQFIWYKDRQTVPMHFYDDSRGWFQLDKAGHMYSAYYESYIGYHALRWAGVSKKKALIYGGSLGLLLQAPIEVFDGLYDGYGFSPTDMIANTAGPLLFVVQEALWDDQVVRMKFSYTPSPYAKYRPAYFGSKETERFFTDYNGHTYWFSANINSIIPPIKSPRWLNLAVGYSANGMLGEFANPSYSRGVRLPEFERTRQYVLSVDIDFSKVRTRKKWLRPILSSLNVLKIPAPVIEYNKTQGFLFRGLYF